MMGTVVPPTASVVAAPAVAAAQQKMSSSFANSFRIAAVAERLALHVKPGIAGNSNMEFCNLCLSLARGIDYAVANNEIPSKAQDLPMLLKLICQRKDDLLLHAVVMVLMISVKNACKIGWFSPKDHQELLALANEIGNGFSSPGDISTAPNDSLSIITTVFSKFYPLLKMGHILTSLEVKPGYGAYVIDFHISKNTMHSPPDKIRLFVAQIDNIETSSCIISPQQVNFLLNGKGVEKRTNVSMDPGPQVPTNVTSMLKYGTNLLQAVGQFNGHYIIAVAFVSMTQLPDNPSLLDYVHSSVAAADPDSDVIEGPSRVSLNCPISYTRIRTPIKGSSCKHLQCFDFSNFVSINSRRPSWRCPHCNQHVCFPNIRVDQNMVKVLKEVGDNITNVIISADGSWKAVLESDENTDNNQKEVLDCRQDVPEQRESESIVDLTEEDDRMDVVGASEIEDRKPYQTTPQSQISNSNLSTSSRLNVTHTVDQSVAIQAEDRFWSDIYFNTGSAQRFVNEILGSPPANSWTSPVITDAISPALNRDSGGHGNHNFSSSMQNSNYSSEWLQLQQIQRMNAAANHAINNEYGMPRQMPRNVNRTPVAVQALPAATQPLVQLQRSRSNLNTAIPGGSSLASQVAPAMTPTSTGISMPSSYVNRHQQYSRSLVNPHQGSSSLQHPSSAQNQNNLGRPVNLVPPAVRATGPPTLNQLPSPLSASPGIRNESPNLHQHQAIRMPQFRSHTSSVGRSPLAQSRNQISQGLGGSVGFANSQHARFMAATEPVQLTRQPPSVPVQIPASRGTSYSNPTMVQRGNVGELQVNSGTDVEQNWQPTGRMRGSLSSQAASTYKDMIIRPTAPTQQTLTPPPPPPPSLTPSQLNVPPAFLSNSRSFYTPQTQQNTATSQPANINRSSGGLQ